MHYEMSGSSTIKNYQIINEDETKRSSKILTEYVITVTITITRGVQMTFMF